MGRKLRAKVTLSPTYLSWEPGGGNKSYFGCWPNRQESGQVPDFSSFPRVGETASISLQDPASKQACCAGSRPPSLPAVASSGTEMWPYDFRMTRDRKGNWPGMGARAKWARSVPCQVLACHGGRSGPVAPQNLWTVNFSFQWRKEAGRAVRLRLGGRSGVESPL